MRNLLKLEEAAMFALGFFLLKDYGLAWWVLLLLFFTPDLGAVGYLVNTRVGAFTYNFVHHKGVALALYFLGLYIAQPSLQIAGLIMFSHSSFDRVFGFGLKEPDSFQSTHLGKIGQ